MNRLSLALLVIFASVTLTFAQDANPLVNSRPWNATIEGGMSVEMTFHPDGSGRLAFGIFGNAINWTTQNDLFCLSGVPGGTVCLTLVVETGAVIGTAPDGKKITFTR